MAREQDRTHRSLNRQRRFNPLHSIANLLGVRVARPGGELCMRQRIVPTVVAVLGICAFISITMYSIYLNAAPDFNIACTGCGSCLSGEHCSCFATEDINLWGM